VTRRLGLTTLAAIAVVASSACGGDNTTAPPPEPADGIRVASFDFAESVLLAEMYAQVIESTGAPVVRLGAVGPREIIAPALEQDRIDLVPEYLGTARQYAGASEPDPETASALADLDDRLAERGLTALEAAPAEDKNVFAVTAEFAEQAGLETISDLAPLAAELRFGGTPECPDRPLCLAGLEDVYGLQFAEFVPQRSLKFTAEALRREEISVGLMFSTAAALVTFDLVVLEDDRLMQPAENIVPVIRADALARWGPDVAEALNAMSRELTTRELRILNVQVGNDVPVETVAREWLTSQRLLDPT
jgi:osmoprotectant transport system substrate-binding protein